MAKEVSIKVKFKISMCNLSREVATGLGDYFRTVRNT